MRGRGRKKKKALSGNFLGNETEEVEGGKKNHLEYFFYDKRIFEKKEKKILHKYKKTRSKLN